MKKLTEQRLRRIIREEIQSMNEGLPPPAGRSPGTVPLGLKLIPKSKEDKDKIQKILDKTYYRKWYRWDSRNGYFIFPEKKSCWHDLEDEIDDWILRTGDDIKYSYEP